MFRLARGEEKEEEREAEKKNKEDSIVMQSKRRQEEVKCDNYSCSQMYILLQGSTTVCPRFKKARYNDSTMGFSTAN